jgi:Flp pilus assembly protein protease CpaA
MVGITIITLVTLVVLCMAFIQPVALRDILERLISQELIVFCIVLGMLISYVESRPEKERWVSPNATQTFVKETEEK